MYALKTQSRNSLATPDDVIDYLIECPGTPDRISAVMCIVETDEELMEKVTRCVDVEKKDIDWYQVFNMDYTPSAYAGLVWAKSLYDGKTMSGKDIFSLIGDMNKKMRGAILEGACIAWNTSFVF